MKLWPRRRPIPGQSRPDGFHLERIPVQLVDAAGEPEPDHIAEHFAALRQRIAELESAQTRGQQHAVMGAAALIALNTMAGQLASGRRVLKAYGADPALLESLNPEPQVEAWLPHIRALLGQPARR